ncbi:hypothetical protein KUL25_07055 [Rhodobacteraceae bacterium N5(2021)]|uniref:LCCL domain-containing protein n=1 Tax=Gymnodinialimonas phycosphaerae TaxID=2841589 RepID=A0A975TX08_9RHOB|nr:LCCL domain-containing protein [Gymnodinialimonas phycosphaerae]MBY4892519.1 hypothetical protein [Gymnodinialimonas phycosphaerae]
MIARGLDTPGATGQIECPANGSLSTVWGTGTYTSDSSICTAALHYGWITREAGGLVGFRQVAGLDSYEGSSQNGVTTLDYGSWSSSFQITSAEPLGSNAGQAIQITWSDDADAIGYGDRVGESVTVICPADRFGAGQVWGTDVYSSDSPICNAAVHRGLMVAAEGGTVTIQIQGEQQAFTGSTRNGVSTFDYGAWPRSYVFP